MRGSRIGVLSCALWSTKLGSGWKRVRRAKVGHVGFERTKSYHGSQSCGRDSTRKKGSGYWSLRVAEHIDTWVSAVSTSTWRSCLGTSRERPKKSCGRPLLSKDCRKRHKRCATDRSVGQRCAS